MPKLHSPPLWTYAQFPRIQNITKIPSKILLVSFMKNITYLKIYFLKFYFVIIHLILKTIKFIYFKFKEWLILYWSNKYLILDIS